VVHIGYQLIKKNKYTVKELKECVSSIKNNTLSSKYAGTYSYPWRNVNFSYVNEI
jgi:hypothetical protein